jgi:hypothetical protein
MQTIKTIGRSGMKGMVKGVAVTVSLAVIAAFSHNGGPQLRSLT